MATPPPIPHFLAHLPTKNGLVIPYISMQVGGRAYLGQTRGLRVAECLIGNLCQVCGRPIEHRPYLFLTTQAMIDDLFSPEPPLHPVCAVYSAKACPMVGGRMATYAKHPPNLDGAPCDKPGCNCAGIVATGPRIAGDPAKPWFQVWCADYAIGVRNVGQPLAADNITGAALTNIIKIRPITAPDITGTRKRAVQ